MPGQPRASGWSPCTPLPAPFAFSFEPLGTLRGDSSPAWGPQSCGFGATMSRQGSTSLFSKAPLPLLPPKAAHSSGPGQVSKSGQVHMFPCVCGCFCATNPNISCLALYGKSVVTPGPGCGPHRCRTALTLGLQGWQGSSPGSAKQRGRTRRCLSPLSSPQSPSTPAAATTAPNLPSQAALGLPEGPSQSLGLFVLLLNSFCRFCLVKGASTSH